MAVESSAARARSNDTRPRGTSAAPDGAQSGNTNVDEDDSDDDEGLPATSAPWKLDVKSMVKDFAREERARGVIPSKPSTKPQAPARPPKAMKAKDCGNRRMSDSEPEKPVPNASEPVPPGEQLFFSRKPRETEFVPATVDEYKQKGYANKEYAELKPTLGPDLDDEELLQKKAMQERKKEF